MFYISIGINDVSSSSSSGSGVVFVIIIIVVILTVTYNTVASANRIIAFISANLQMS